MNTHDLTASLLVICIALCAIGVGLSVIGFTEKRALTASLGGSLIGTAIAGLIFLWWTGA